MPRPSAPSVLDPSPSPYRMAWGLFTTCALLAFFGFFSANGLITSAAFLSLPIICYLVWREGEPPVLVFACVFQWLQATASIFYTNQLGVTLAQAFGSSVLTTATWLSIAAVLALALGIRCGFYGAGPSRRHELERDAVGLDLSKVMLLYGASFVVSAGLRTVAWLVPSATQPILAVAALKWAFVFLVCYTVLQQRKGYGYLALCVALEFATGLFGAFATFKSVFFVLAVAAMTSPSGLRGRRLLANAVCFILLFVTGVVWTAVKMDYRTFLSSESNDIEEIRIERKFAKLADLVDALAWNNVVDGVDAMVMRVSYVHYFALTLDNVPARVPFENGRLWGGSVIHVLTPRLFFPEKQILDDSERTRLYAGVEVSGVEQNTSIGIGYVGESYIDFGPIGMFAPIFLLGIMYGLINRCFLTKTRYKLLGSSLAVAALIFNAYEIETSNIKVFGGTIAATIASVVIYRFFGNTIISFMRAKQNRGPCQP